MKTIFSLIKIIIILTFYENIRTIYVQNPDFFPRGGFLQRGWYQADSIPDWKVRHAHFQRAFYISKWPQAAYEIPSTCLVMFMNRRAIYYQQNIQLQSGFYKVSGDMLFQAQEQHNHVQYLQFYVQICESRLTAVVRKTPTKIRVSIGDFYLSRDQVCQLRILQRHFSHNKFKVSISDITVTPLILHKKKKQKQQKSSISSKKSRKRKQRSFLRRRIFK